MIIPYGHRPFPGEFLRTQVATVWLKRCCKSSALYWVLSLISFAPQSATAWEIKAEVSVDSRYFADTPSEKNPTRPWPGDTSLDMRSGQGVFEWTLQNRAADGLNYDSDDDIGTVTYDQPGVYDISRISEAVVPTTFDPKTAWAGSSLSMQSSEMSNEFGSRSETAQYVVGAHAKVIDPSESYRWGDSGTGKEPGDEVFYNEFTHQLTGVDQSFLADGSNRVRFFGRESYGLLDTKTPYWRAPILPFAFWENQMDLRSSEIAPAGNRYDIVPVSEERWHTRGIASVELTQAENLREPDAIPYSHYPDPLLEPSVPDSLAYDGEIKLRCAIIPELLRDLLYPDENHEAQFYFNGFYQENNEIYPFDDYRSIGGAAGIINGDFYAVGNMASLDWQFTVLPGDVFPVLEARAVFDTLATFSVDYNELFSGQMEYQLFTHQKWGAYAEVVPETSSLCLSLLGMALLLGRGVIRRRTTKSQSQNSCAEV